MLKGHSGLGAKDQSFPFYWFRKQNLGCVKNFDFYFFPANKQDF